ncbi:MAG TPA: VRR-NUC domain-containing protein [Buttiauxella sp.]
MKSARFTDEWLKDFQQRSAAALPKTRRITAANALLAASKTSSPHQAALNYLERHPEHFKKQPEHYEQARIFRNFELFNIELYDLLTAVPNGGKRSKATAGKMKAEGQKSGYPDTILDAPRGVYFGMRLELKYGKNRPSDNQKAILNRLTEQGYYCVVAYGHKEAIRLLETYWELDADEAMPEYETDKLWSQI